MASQWVQVLRIKIQELKIELGFQARLHRPPDSAIAHRLLDGLSGLEIGASANNPFHLNTKNVGLTEELDKQDFEFFKQAQVRIGETWTPIDIPADAAAIPVLDSSQDFVLHSHVWEHLPNPLGALEEWVRIVKPNGFVFAIVPKRDALPDDKGRPITPLATYIKHYEQSSTVAERSAEEFIYPRAHYNVFSPSTLRDIATWYNLTHDGVHLKEVGFQETDDKIGNGHTIVWYVFKGHSLASGKGTTKKLLGLESLQGNKGLLDIHISPAASERAGILSLSDFESVGMIKMSIFNTGEPGMVTISGDTGGLPLPVAIHICERKQIFGTCRGDPLQGITRWLRTGRRIPFKVIVFVRGYIPLQLPPSRIFVRVTDERGITCGVTSIPIQTKISRSGSSLVFTLGQNCSNSGSVGTELQSLSEWALQKSETRWHSVAKRRFISLFEGKASLKKRDSFIASQLLPAGLVASISPICRSLQVGNTATVQATIINAGYTMARECSINPITSMPGKFSFQAVNMDTNKLPGKPNEPVDIPANKAQTFLMRITLTDVMEPTTVLFHFKSLNVIGAPIILGVNTLQLSASTRAVPDIVALVATPTNDGVIHLPGATGGIGSTGVFVVASLNVGATGTMTVSADTGTVSLPLAITICQTNTGTGACLAPPSSTVTTDIVANTTPSFGVFVEGLGPVPFDPGANRIFIRFKDQGDITRGSTSVAVQTP